MRQVERILGIDPGRRAMGFGLIDTCGHDVKLVEFGAISTDASDPLPQRLHVLFHETQEIINQYKPDRMAFEKLIYCKNVSIAMLMGQARGAIITAGAQLALPMVEYNPTEIKSAIVGRGRATKEQVQKMIRVLLNLEDVPEPDHAADALAAALTYVYAKPINQALASVLETTKGKIR